MEGARQFAKQIEFFVGPETTVKFGNYEMRLYGQSSVAISGQIEADYLYQILLTFHKIMTGRAEEFLADVYGDRAVAQEKVDAHEFWNSLIKSALCEDRKHVCLTIEKVANLSADDFLVYMNDGKTGHIIDCMLLNQALDPLIAVFDMYNQILWQHRAERVFADFLNIQLDEANLAARMNCAHKVVQLFPQENLFGVATITLGQLPVMEHANDNLEQDHLLDCLIGYVEVSREQALKMNGVKLPETTRRCLKEEMERMLRKAINRNREYVFHTLAEFVGLTNADLAVEFVGKPAHVINRLYEKCYRSPGAVMNLYDRLTSIPKKLWRKDYKSSTDTSDYASDGGKRYVTPWTINDDRVEEKLKESVKEFYEKKEKKGGKEQKGKENSWQAKENKNRKSRKINKKKKQGQQRKTRDKNARKEKEPTKQLQPEVADGNFKYELAISNSEDETTGPNAEEEEIKRKLREIEQDKERVDKVEGQLYDQLLEMDKQKDDLVQKQRVLDEREKRVNAEADRVLKLKRENEALVQAQARKREEEAEDRRRETEHHKLIWQRLQQISVEEAQLRSRRDQMNEEHEKAQSLSIGLTQKQQQLQTEWDKFEAYKNVKQQQLQKEKDDLLEMQRAMNDQHSTNTIDLCQRLLQMTTGVAADTMAQATGTRSTNIMDHTHQREPPTGVLVDIGPQAGPSHSNPSSNNLAGGQKKGKSCAANCPCREHTSNQTHTEEKLPMPKLEENIARPRD